MRSSLYNSGVLCLLLQPFHESLHQGVPALVTREGKILTKVPAITWYIAEGARSIRLLPQGGLPLARCLEWFNWLSGTVHTMAFGQYWRAHRFLEDEKLYPPPAAEGSQERPGVLRLYREPAHGQALGRDPGLLRAVDAYLAVLYRWGNCIGLPMGADYPEWTAHARRLMERPALQRALEQEGVTLWDNPD